MKVNACASKVLTIPLFPTETLGPDINEIKIEAIALTVVDLDRENEFKITYDLFVFDEAAETISTMLFMNNITDKKSAVEYLKENKKQLLQLIALMVSISLEPFSIEVKEFHFNIIEED